MLWQGESSLFTSSAWARAMPENINTVISTDAAIVPTLASIDRIRPPDYSTNTAVPYANSSEAPAVTALVAKRTLTIALAPRA